jgi:hypothetical protein
MTVVGYRTRRRFAAILRDSVAEIDDAIQWLQTFDEPGEAVDSVCSRCGARQQWAVVDLTDRRVVKRGGGANGPGAGGVLARPAQRRVL